jgi:hypothetical protein
VIGILLLAAVSVYAAITCPDEWRWPFVALTAFCSFMAGRDSRGDAQ